MRFYSWSDYIGSKAIPTFTAETGTKVLNDVFDSNDLAEAKLLAGKSGCDLATPNPSAANAFINTLMRPEIAAAAAIETGFATANREALKLVPADITGNPNLYPPADVIVRLTLPKVHSQKVVRAWQDAWLRAKGLK